MSKFSDKCRELLTENGYNVYRLSQAASLERTTLQRMVTGKRLPGQEFVENFCRALRIPFLEEKEVMELYKMESIGESAYLNQKTILQLFDTLSNLDKEEKRNNYKVIDHGDLELLSPIADDTYDTEMLLQFILKKTINTEDQPIIYTNIPGTNTLLSHYLMLLAPQYQKEISVKHLIYFQTNISSAHANLETLNQVLPLCFSKTIHYEPFYYYSKLSKSDQPNLLFPFYIITGNYVLQLSGNFEKGILHSDPHIIKEYKKEFERCLCQSMPLLQQSNNLEESLNLYLTCQNQPKNIITLEPALCDTDLISKQQFVQLVTQYTPEYIPMLNAYNAFVDMVHQTSRTSFFTEAGLKKFCKSGITSGTSHVIFPAFNEAERVSSLKHYLAHYENSEKKLLNQRFVFPDSFYIELRDKRTLHFIRTVDKDNITFITIQESSICDAFEEFFEILGNSSEYVFSDKDLLSLLKDELDHLNS